MGEREYQHGYAAGLQAARECPIRVMPARLSAVYLLIGRGVVVYVGQSQNLFSRVAAHPRNLDFESVILVPCDEKDLGALETALIARYRPPFNRNAGPQSSTEAADCGWIVRAVAQETGIQPPARPCAKRKVSGDETGGGAATHLEMTRRAKKAEMEQRLERIRKS